MVKQADIWIQLADLERFAPSPVGEYVAGKVVIDALGRGWVADPDAKAALAKAEAAWQQEIADRGAYARWADDRNEKRRALAAKVRDQAIGGRMVTPDSSVAVQARVQEALAGFDERNPELGLYEWKDQRPKAAR
jgi:hypothetical protein